MIASSQILPPILIIILLAGFSTLSETVYIPSLPDIAISLNTSESMIEHTLTIYLFGFTLGILFWGNLSDKIGRKPCIIQGLVIYIVGCIGCYFSVNIEMLMLSRFIQAFGGSIGSVLGQSIVRDVFIGKELAKAYANVSISLAIFPFIGPIIGGAITEKFSWHSVFLFLILFALAFIILVAAKLPETNKFENNKNQSLLKVALRLYKDSKVIKLGFVVAICNGIIFSYCAEGPFYLMNILGLSPREYGLTFIAIAISVMFGGNISKRLHRKNYTPQSVMNSGIKVMFASCISFCFFIIVHSYITPLSVTFLIAVTVLSQMMLNLGICMTTSNALTLALEDYRDVTGRASSIFGCFYYFFTSIVTLIMGLLHNGSLTTMPFYFLFLACIMIIINQFQAKIL